MAWRIMASWLLIEPIAVRVLPKERVAPAATASSSRAKPRSASREMRISPANAEPSAVNLMRVTRSFILCCVRYPYWY
jgi:hypothetical protein